MPHRIVLYGATGYTGGLTARAMVASGSRPSVFAGYLFAAALMAVAAWVAARYAVEAERKPLEMVATPLSAIPAAGD